MSRMTHDRVYICGGNYDPGPRAECPNALHDHPLPVGYCEAGDVADERLEQGWGNVKCPDCGKYGWTAP